jgi:Ca-activated chloride channel family protein
MSLGSPFVRIILVAVPAAIVAARLISRRGPSPIAFTNLAVLETAARTPPPAAPATPSRRAALACARRGRDGRGTPAGPAARAGRQRDDRSLVDVSGSMSALDVEPTRLDAAVSGDARLPWSGFRRVQGRPRGSRTSRRCSRRRPRIRDLRTRAALSPIRDGLGACLATAFRLTKCSLSRDGVVAPPGRKLPAAIILLSDGKQNQGRIRPLQAAALARAAGIPVDTVALGTPHGVLGIGPFAPRVAPAPALMRRIARATSGATATAKDTKELTGFYRRIGTSIGHGTKTRDIGAWFAAAAAVLLVAAAALGRRFGTLT